MAESPAYKSKAAELSEQLGLPLFNDASAADVVLVVAEQCFLRRLASPVVDWTIDFQSPAYTNKFAQRGRKRDPLSKAIGLHKKEDLKVLDMTAGLGKDALWLAHCGAKVTLIERHPVLAFLLAQAAQAISDNPMQVVHTSAEAFLASVNEGDFDVAYYDPMFDPRKKSALVKKDMQILQALHGEEGADPALITQALNKIPKVVVKRGKLDTALLDGWHHQIFTQTTRFDVYTK